VNDVSAGRIVACVVALRLDIFPATEQTVAPAYSSAYGARAIGQSLNAIPRSTQN
jgi:hypothetical protein